VTKIIVTGATGRMGSTLARRVSEAADLELVAVTSRTAQVPEAGGCPVFVSLENALHAVSADVVIDFTAPASSVAHAKLCAARKLPMVVGTTGFDTADKSALTLAAQSIPVVVAPNTSVGVNVVIQMAAKLAKALGEGYDVEIVELHHRRKKDAPSGTALKLAEEMAHVLGRTSEDFRFERQGHTGERPSGEIGLQSLRGGDVVGEHTVYFVGEGERVELTHRATHRDQFALGALRAARWVTEGRKAGIYGMSDVLGLGT
jgi:4-hydroxy-tetrahydrodipicolinate reductase